MGWIAGILSALAFVVADKGLGAVANMIRGGSPESFARELQGIQQRVAEVESHARRTIAASERRREKAEAPFGEETMGPMLAGDIGLLANTIAGGGSSMAGVDRERVAKAASTPAPGEPQPRRLSVAEMFANATGGPANA